VDDGRWFWHDFPRQLWVLLAAALVVTAYGLLTWLLSFQSGATTVQIDGAVMPVLQPPVTAAILLALGTAALAYSAYIQARASRALADATKSQAESAERARRAALRPTLDVQIWEPSQGSDSSAALRPVMGSIFNTDVRGRTRLLRCVVRNLGPGNAVMVDVVGPVWYLPEEGPWEKVKSVSEPDSPTLPPFFPVVEDRSLKANDEHWFDIPLASPIGSDGAVNGTYRIINKVVLKATAKDVEGNEAPPYSLVVRLHQISPIGSVALTDTSTGTQVAAPCYQLLWTNVPVRGKR